MEVKVCLYLQDRRPLRLETSHRRPVGLSPMVPTTVSLTYCLKHKHTWKMYQGILDSSDSNISGEKNLSAAQTLDLRYDCTLF